MLRLVHAQLIPLSAAIRTLSHNPAKLLGLETGTLKKGAPADLILIDIDEPWILTEETLKSRSKNTAFEGAQFTGRVHRTYVDGREVYRQN